MMLALDASGERISAMPDAKGICPVCDSDLIPKCGEIKTWHWAHKSVRECDSWAEPESEWHYGWKKLAGLQNTEIVIKKDDKKHRADIRTPGGLVIELQHSPMSTTEVREREKFYGRMIWIIDGNEVCPGLVFDQYVSKDDRLYFKHGDIKKAWVNEITKPLYIHFNHKYFDTYHYYMKYEMHYGVLSKKLRKLPVEGAPREFSDFLLKIKGKYCEVIPNRVDFLRGLGLDGNMPGKALFAF